MTDLSKDAVIDNLEARLRTVTEERDRERAMFVDALAELRNAHAEQTAKLRETIVRQKADLDTIALVQTEQQERARRSDCFIGGDVLPVAVAKGRAS